MKIVLSLVSSLNGRIDAGALADSRRWASQEDAAFFRLRKARFRLIVMGRKTYEVNKLSMSLQQNVLRVVLTRNPKKYHAFTVPNQLEFTDMPPVELVGQLETRGYASMLLAGGGQINRLFFQANLVDEVHVSIEPRLFGKGTNMIAPTASEIPLEVVRAKLLNARGTLHVVYRVIK